MTYKIIGAIVSSTCTSGCAGLSEMQEHRESILTVPVGNMSIGSRRRAYTWRSRSRSCWMHLFRQRVQRVHHVGEKNDEPSSCVLQMRWAKRGPTRRGKSLARARAFFLLNERLEGRRKQKLPPLRGKNECVCLKERSRYETRKIKERKEGKKNESFS